ncbi:15-cis-phytoene synthase CrtB [Erwinia phyllosphaerae]|uniref:15-cis-phytoene synthase CrtB n=1 Tax=Erwinia phyllosphaerae TaxID=2853256 RepID=UPI001FEE93D8|nr:15-cis-phytoene synthase CrtB [Erwinia phyllosphaerae]MBV4366839.1 phytoene/squalene synthase family protein [Erwinia phyllosphaerae]
MNEPLLSHATETMAVGSKSFATAAKLFDPATRRSALMLYAWCRHCDDVIDDQQLGFRQENSAQTTPEARLQMLKALTIRACMGESMSDPAFAAFQEVALAHAIPQQQAFDHLEGYAMDVRGDLYYSLDDTLRYCYHVAGVVGLMMARVMGVRDEAVLDRACDLGLAFQLTNIARDIVEDAQTGRCYLPIHWLEEEGLTLKNYAEPVNRERLARVADRLVAAAEPYYLSADAGLAGLPLRSAWAIATARGVYREIGVKVRKAGTAAWERRQGTSKAEKLGLLAAGGCKAIASRLAASAPPRPAALWQRPRAYDGHVAGAALPEV